MIKLLFFWKQDTATHLWVDGKRILLTHCFPICLFTHTLIVMELTCKALANFEFNITFKDTQKSQISETERYVYVYI